MANSTTNAHILKPEEVEQLVVRPFVDLARATMVSTVIRTASPEVRLPVVTTDPAAAWTAEGAEIALSDLGTAEVLVTPKKLGGLVKVSAELADDSDPEAARVVGMGMVRDLVRQADAAYYGSNAAVPEAPAGLEDLVGVGTVGPVTAWADLDPFAQAISQAEQEGEVVTNFVANPSDALILSQLKEDSTDSNVPLLGGDPVEATARSILGVPLLTSRSVTVGTIWAIPRAASYVVIRRDSTVRRDDSVYFSSDQVAVRGILRVSWGFPHPASVQRITL